MPVEMPNALPFSVDTWTPSSRKKRHHFLTHAHRDHSVGICSHARFPIYSTPITKAIILLQFPQLDDSIFVDIKVGQSIIIQDPDGAFTVTAFDANHCAGNFGNILHTGDCRLTPECLQNLPGRYLGKKGKEPGSPLDVIFLDCTFGRCFQEFPSKHSAIRQVSSCIWKHPEAPLVYLSCSSLLGQEEVLKHVSQTFGSKIYIDESTNSECYRTLALTVPEMITKDSSSRFHMLHGLPRLYQRALPKLAETEGNSLPEPLVIRPSTQWYAQKQELSGDWNTRKQRIDESVRDPSGVWHVCYSMHSSRDELEWALQILAPKWVISTTPDCRAMELDYVKRRCLGSKASKETLGKLLEISMECSSNGEISAVGLNCTPVSEGRNQVYGEARLQPAELFTGLNALNGPQASKIPPVTLFGRARLRTEAFALSPSQVPSIYHASAEAVADRVEVISITDDDDEATNRSVGVGKEAVPETGNLVGKKTVVPKVASPVRVGFSRGFNEKFRKLYRSMNVPVPEPLPRLMELVRSRARSKRRFEL